MVLLSLQGLRPSMNLVACRLSRPCIPSKCTFRAALRRTERRYTSRTHLAKAADDEFDAQLENDINESTLAIDEMVTSISKNLFIDTATAYVVGENATTAAFEEAVSTTVTSRLDTLNATFLPIINSYIDSVEQNGEEQRDLLGVLLAIKGQVLSQLAERLPPEMRIIQKALEAATSDERMQLIRAESSTSSINPGSLAFTVARMIQDFEGDDDSPAEEIADRGLLARLCLLREELRQLADEAEMTPWKKTTNSGAETGNADSNEVNVEVMIDNEDGGGGNSTISSFNSDNNNESTGNTAAPEAAPSAGASPYTALRGVPAREVSFLKEIVNVASSEKRRALLETAFQGSSASSPDDESSINTSINTGLIRPGAFMDCIKALQTEMLGPKYGYGTEANQATLIRLEEIWRESVLVLEDLAGHAEYMP